MRKGVQQLTDRLTALGRFISLFTDRLKPFFATLRGVNRGGWNEECDQALVKINHYLAEPPILTSPEAGETLFIYLAVSDVAVSVVLFKDYENKSQRLVFFVSKSLADAETRYNHLEQAALALQMAAKKLRPYFQAHPIVMLTNLPLRSTIHKPDLYGRMTRWVIELSEYGISYKPRLAKKGQVLADFLAEVTQPKTSFANSNWWILCVDKASRKIGASIGLQLKSPGGDKIKQAIRLGFNASNNESECQAILVGIELAAALSTDKLIIQSDSQLVVG